jgi:SAF domain-containing protein
MSSLDTQPALTLGQTTSAPPTRARRRRPRLLAAGIAIVTTGALAAAWLVSATSNTIEVIRVQRPITAGQTIAREDLAVATINAGTGLATVPRDRASDIIGKRAAISLLPGQLITDSAVADQLVPATGQSMLGVTVDAAHIPSEPLEAGDVVDIVSTPNEGDDPPTEAGDSITATVVSVSAIPDTDRTVVNVVVPAAQAHTLAARAATGRVAIVVTSRER